MEGKFELYQDSASKWRWRLRNDKGVAIAVGQAHETKGGAQTEIGRVVKAAKDAPTIQLD